MMSCSACVRLALQRDAVRILKRAAFDADAVWLKLKRAALNADVGRLKLKCTVSGAGWDRVKMKCGAVDWDAVCLKSKRAALVFEDEWLKTKRAAWNADNGRLILDGRAWATSAPGLESLAVVGVWNIVHLQSLRALATVNRRL